MKSSGGEEGGRGGREGGERRSRRKEEEGKEGPYNVDLNEELSKDGAEGVVRARCANAKFDHRVDLPVLLREPVLVLAHKVLAVGRGGVGDGDAVVRTEEEALVVRGGDRLKVH